MSTHFGGFEKGFLFGEKSNKKPRNSSPDSTTSRQSSTTESNSKDYEKTGRHFGGFEKGFLFGKKSNKKPRNSSPDSTTSRQSSTTESNSKDYETTGRHFGGFKKGFLLGEKSNKKTQYSSLDSSTSRQPSGALSTSLATESTPSVSTQSATATAPAKSTAALSSLPKAASFNQQSKAPSSSSTSTSSSNPKQIILKEKRFGGFESGFLSRSPSKKNTINRSTVGKEDNAEDKKSSEEKESSHTPKAKKEQPNINSKSKQTCDPLCFSEVQAAMGDSEEALKEKADQVTKELLERLEQNESIKQKLQDPKNVEVINEFQQDPKSAMEKYNSSPEIQQFFTEFRDFLVLGSNCSCYHQSGAGMSGVRSAHQNHQPTSVDEQKMQEFLSNMDSDARDLFMDPETVTSSSQFRSRKDTKDHV